MIRLRSLLTFSNLARFALLALLLYSLHGLGQMKPPWKTTMAKHLAEGKDLTFKEHLANGLWYGAACRAGLCGMLLVASVAWGLGAGKKPGEPTTLCLRKPGNLDISARHFAIALGVLVLAALTMRLPRMTHSFWGDEADAMATYVHGSYRPIKKKEPEGRLFFEPATWTQTFFSARHGANNHVLFSVSSRISLEIWRKITGKPDTAYTEWVARVPSLIAGLASLVATALLMRCWGWPLLGLVTALVMAIHPWHVRYSTEARGYAMMLMLLPVLFIVLTTALEKNRWRDWLAFALLEFLLMYSWAGIMYALVTLNLAMAVLMLQRKDRVPLFVRWTTANLLAAMVFLSLFLPHVTQIQEAGRRLLWTKGQPMDKVWFHNLITQPFTGIPYHDLTPGNPAEISWERLFSQSPVVTTMGFAVILGSFLAGYFGMWRRSKKVAWLVSSVLGASVLCTLHFKYVLQDELRAWYLIFTLPMVCLCVALGWLEVSAQIGRRFSPRSISATAAALGILFLLSGASLWSMTASVITQPEEDYKGAVAATLEQHESFSPKGASAVSTIWLWRYSALYDPRGDSRVRNGPALQKCVEESRRSKRELYVIVGYRALAALLSADLLAILEDPAQFEKTAVFPARESLHTLEVYHLMQP